MHEEPRFLSIIFSALFFTPGTTTNNFSRYSFFQATCFACDYEQLCVLRRLPVTCWNQILNQHKKNREQVSPIPIDPEQFARLVCTIKVEVPLLVFIAVIFSKEVTSSVYSNCIFYKVIKVFNKFKQGFIC